MSRTARSLILFAGGALLLFGLFSVSLVALREPFAIGDYVGSWGLKARALFRWGSVEGTFRVDPWGISAHPEYPPLWPLLLAGFSSLRGHYDDLVVTPLWPMLCADSSLLAIRATRAAAPFAVLSGAAVALLPYWRTYPGYAEGLLLVFVLAALGEAGRLDAGGGAALRFAFFLTLATWTKLEGAVAALVAAGILFAARKLRVGLLTGLSSLFLAVVPWRAAVWLFDPGRPRTDFALSSFSPSKLVVALGTLATQAFPYAGWVGGAALLLAVAPATRARRRGVLLWCALYPSVLACAFVFSRLDPAWQMRWSWDRLAVIPAAVLLTVLVEALAECVEGRTSAPPLPASSAGVPPPAPAPAS